MPSLTAAPDAKIVVAHPPGKPTEYRVERSDGDGPWLEVMTFTGRNGLRSANAMVKFIKGEQAR